MRLGAQRPGHRERRAADEDAVARLLGAEDRAAGRAAGAWLRSRSGPAIEAGADAQGWERTTWVLHTMYAWQGAGTAPTQPDDPSARSLFAKPGPGWVNVRWSAVARGLSAPLRHQDLPPSFRWFDLGFDEGPAELMGPLEGSLDALAWEGLVEVLARHSQPDQPVNCWYSGLTHGFSTFDEVLYRRRLDEIGHLMAAEDGPQGTPTNMWAADESWFVWTDWDLWATKVSGSAQLIADLRSHPALDCLDWPRETLGPR